jgi:iron complex outermembrane receptor protein
LQADGGSLPLPGYSIKISEFGSPSIRSEIEHSAEAGYRLQSGQRWSIDESVFWSHYSRLRALSYSPQPSVMIVDGAPVLEINMIEGNEGSGRSYGSETAATWQVDSKWRLIPSYSYLNETRWLPNSPTTSYDYVFHTSGARHQGLLRSQYDVAREWQLDLMARARSRNRAFDLPGVLLFDAHIGWRPSRSSELSFTVQNLLGRSVVETISEAPFVAIPLRRTIALRWTQRF